jgi:AraC-like DNA-binding protein
MIIAYVTDPALRAAVRLAGHPEEDVVLDPAAAEEALSGGHPRIVVRSPDGLWPVLHPFAPAIPVLTLTQATLARWDSERHATAFPGGRTEWLGSRIALLVERQSSEVTWVDRTLADLGRAAGSPLPPALRGFGRRILEFPAHYDDLYPLADAFGLSPGALKSRFRRRGMVSPSIYLRWFRAMAVAYELSDRTVTVAQVANRLGYTSDGNLCRSLMSLTGMTPTEARSLKGWNRLLISFAWTYLGSEAVEPWHDLGDLFLTRAA